MTIEEKFKSWLAAFHGTCEHDDKTIAMLRDAFYGGAVSFLGEICDAGVKGRDVLIGQTKLMYAELTVFLEQKTKEGPACARDWFPRRQSPGN